MIYYGNYMYKDGSLSDTYSDTNKRRLEKNLRSLMLRLASNNDMPDVIGKVYKQIAFDLPREMVKTFIVRRKKNEIQKKS